MEKIKPHFGGKAEHVVQLPRGIVIASEIKTLKDLKELAAKAKEKSDEKTV